MNTLNFRISPYCLLLGCILVLGGCNNFNQGNPTANVLNPTPTPKIETLPFATSTLEMKRTLETPESNLPSLTPSLTLPTSPSSTPTLLATLDPEAAQKEIAFLMTMNDHCSGICFWGITPGLTKFDQAVTQLNILGEKGLEGIYESHKYFNIDFPYPNDNIVISLVLIESNGDVQRISAGLDGLNDPKITGKDWSAFRPDSILRTYGIPKQVKIIMGQGPEGRVGYQMAFLYDQAFFSYDGNQIIIRPANILHACPLVSHKINQFDLELGQFEQPNIWAFSKDIDQVSSLSTEDFYKVMTGDPGKACFDLDYSKFASN